MRRRTRGATLVEILLSLAVVLVGMLAMFRVLASSVQGGASSSHLSQAQFRAETILEAIRSAPSGALACLSSTPPGNWSNCEALCRTLMGATPSAQSCIFTVDSMVNVPTPDIVFTTTGVPAAHSAKGLTVDRNQQNYEILVDNQRDNHDTFVFLTGPNGRVYDAQVSVGWNDDSTSSFTAKHAVTLRTGVFN